MHPEVQKEKPGRCPKCGMKLSLQTATASTRIHETPPVKTTWKSYMPLVVIFGILLVASLAISLNDMHQGVFAISKTISYFMAGFFLVFSGFKLMDLPGFAQGYFTYDLLAKKIFGYGYVYPFIELLFGILMIVRPESKILLGVEIILMVFSGIGVAIKLARKERFQCACLGTFLKVPLTKVTLIEDFGMAILAIVMLFLTH